MYQGRWTDGKADGEEEREVTEMRGQERATGARKREGVGREGRRRCERG